MTERNHQRRPLILRTVETKIGLKLALFDTEGFLIDGQIDVNIDHPANAVSTVRVTFLLHHEDGVIQAPTIDGEYVVEREAEVEAAALAETGPGCGAAGCAQNCSQVGPSAQAAADAPTRSPGWEFTSDDAWDAASRSKLWGNSGGKV